MTALPNGLTSGTWNIDPAHSSFSFVARHGGISKVRGKFDVIGGQATIGEDFESLTVNGSADPKSINTGIDQRDEHLRSADFFLADEHPEITFESTGVEDFDGEEFTLNGKLTIRGVTKDVSFDAEFMGAQEDPYGNKVAGISATTKVNRKDFGMTFSGTMPGGDMLVSDKITIEIDAELIKA